uniref:ATP synthase F0 subunit 6 n=1 Tax=Mytilisepta virgata TaxID=2547956 RepID=UPI0022A6C284|nr:ATP synthase F0 subunit 6 [Mytilisepta virgata]UZT27178.1 ATP synthase F0 subunit 6 [Mytilisepta virgata]
MVMDVFSVFDNDNFNSFSLNVLVWSWSLFLLVTFLSKLMLWVDLTRVKSFFYTLGSFVLDFVGKVEGLKLTGFAVSIFSLFSLILWINLSSVVPYFFPVSCHVPYIASFSLYVWMGLVMSSLVNSWVQVVGSLVPSGSPMSLSPLLVLTEIVSSAVRPLVLVMRLVFNLVTGQILFGLLGEVFSEALLMGSVLNLGLLTVVMMVYSFFEIFVCVLQAYIFCQLLCSYSEDHSSFRWNC